MSFADAYLSRNSQYNALVDAEPAKDLEIIVVIPAYNESGFETSLDSLFSAKAIEGSVEIICVVNYPEDISQEEKDFNEQIYTNMIHWADKHTLPKKKFHILKLAELPHKTAGVGMARKLGMDEAVQRFNSLNCRNGIICSYDADTSCEPNYFQAISEHFLKNPDTDACSLYFEHPLEGNEFPASVYKGIIKYELHLRYYLGSLRYAGHPNCYQTVGSAFAVKADAYCQQGGMNKRKAAEDFYFLQKFFDIGRFSECSLTRVLPSPRPSDRVPFGTGASIREFIGSDGELFTFNPDLFIMLKQFISNVNGIKDMQDITTSILKGVDKTLLDYLEKLSIKNILSEIIENSNGPESFRKRFFRWFNMFRILKFLNYAEKYQKQVPVSIAANKLLEYNGHATIQDETELLIEYRRLEKDGFKWK